MTDHDNWKLSSDHEDAPELDAVCEGCGEEGYEGNMEEGHCEDCRKHSGPDWGECPDAYDSRMARREEEAEIIQHGLRSDHDYD
ncbi:MAG TPA: hypothetical protein EYN66_06025 [Myxococcales bacterium]|nr:hypothetical protein [Myxococcales bacterium]